MKGAAAVLGRRRLRLPIRVALPRPTPRVRRVVLLAGALLLLLAAGYQFWLRDSSLVAVDDVTVTGLTTKDAARIRGALTGAAASMTTLHVDRDELDQVVSIYPVVRELRVTTDFPHGVTIRVIEHRPAALARIGGDSVPVAGDGTLLRGLPVEGRLPSIEGGGGVDGDSLSGSEALREAHVAGAAPAALRRRLDEITTRSGDGIVVEVRDGPELIFGDATRARAKWLAAARVLADPEAEGASYIDVRLPGRPAAGGLPAETVEPVAPAGQAQLPPTAPATGAAPTTTATPTQPAPTTGATAAPPATGAPATGVTPGAAMGQTGAAPPTAAPPAGTTPAAPTGTPTDGTGTGAVGVP